MRAVDRDHSREVVLVDIDMPLLDMVAFMIKWALASIPAAIFLAIVFGGVYAVFVGLIVGLIRR